MQQVAVCFRVLRVDVAGLENQLTVESRSLRPE